MITITNGKTTLFVGKKGKTTFEHACTIKLKVCSLEYDLRFSELFVQNNIRYVFPFLSDLIKMKEIFSMILLSVCRRLNSWKALERFFYLFFINTYSLQYNSLKLFVLTLLKPILFCSMETT